MVLSPLYNVKSTTSLITFSELAYKYLDRYEQLALYDPFSFAEVPSNLQFSLTNITLPKVSLSNLNTDVESPVSIESSGLVSPKF